MAIKNGIIEIPQDRPIMIGVNNRGEIESCLIAGEHCLCRSCSSCQAILSPNHKVEIRLPARGSK